MAMMMMMLLVVEKINSVNSTIAPDLHGSILRDNERGGRVLGRGLREKGG